MYVGEHECAHHLVPFLANALHAASPEATITTTEIRSGRDWTDPIAELADESADLTALVAPHHLARHRTPSSLDLPLRVHQLVDTSTPWPQVEQRITRRERTAIRRGVEAHGYTVEIDHDGTLLNHFYDRLYHPTMSSRHGTSARTATRTEAFRLFTDGGILLTLHSAGTFVAGALCHRTPDGVLHGRLIGLLEGDDEWRRRGAMSVLYREVLRWATENDAPHVDLSGGEPFLSKGTFQFKRKFGATTTIPRTWLGARTTTLTPKRDSPLMRRFLIDNPPIAHNDDNSLSARYYFDHTTPPRLDLSDNCEGLTTRHLTDLDNFPWDRT
ncbi:GNAT family N-acetyltransferase [Actinosynnema sp. NPDC020468]|uniref:GNAT family N-acetyltransferase n=1 Tax=Actinosynnema sp. NPDC020468 TaxID=3154488 RepID=UPI0033C14118